MTTPDPSRLQQIARDAAEAAVQAWLCTPFGPTPESIVLAALEEATAGLQIQLAAEKIYGEFGRQWEADSSLERWFPITAEGYKKLEEKVQQLRAELDQRNAGQSQRCWLATGSRSGHEDHAHAHGLPAR